MAFLSHARTRDQCSFTPELATSWTWTRKAESAKHTSTIDLHLSSSSSLLVTRTVFFSALWPRASTWLSPAVDGWKERQRKAKRPSLLKRESRRTTSFRSACQTRTANWWFQREATRSHATTREHSETRSHFWQWRVTFHDLSKLLCFSELVYFMIFLNNQLFYLF